jgi:hypothetical protein
LIDDLKGASDLRPNSHKVRRGSIIALGKARLHGLQSLDTSTINKLELTEIHGGNPMVSPLGYVKNFLCAREVQFTSHLEHAVLNGTANPQTS